MVLTRVTINAMTVTPMQGMVVTPTAQLKLALLALEELLLQQILAQRYVVMENISALTLVMMVILITEMVAQALALLKHTTLALKEIRI